MKLVDDRFTLPTGSYVCYVENLHLGYDHFYNEFNEYCMKRLGSRFDKDKIETYKNIELDDNNIPYICFRHLLTKD